MLGLPRNASDTVETDTPASRAISAICGRAERSPPSSEADDEGKEVRGMRHLRGVIVGIASL
jgi:hypothetical protein